MCGIVGIACFNKRGIICKDYDLFEDLLVADSLRGSDGTGILMVTTGGSPHTLKIGSDPFALMGSKEYRNKFSDLPIKKDIRFVVGHNRYATTGKVETACAHPFHEGKIILVHNGTLNNWSKHDKKYPVDSQALAALIDEKGIDEAIDMISGAWAIVYYDTEARTMHFLRNAERPLYIGYDKKMNRIVWASEKEMLDWVLHRNHETGYEIGLLQENTLMTFGMKNVKPTIREVKKKYVTTYSYPDYGSSVEGTGTALITTVETSSNEEYNDSEQGTASVITEDDLAFLAEQEETKPTGYRVITKKEYDEERTKNKEKLNSAKNFYPAKKYLGWMIGDLILFKTTGWSMLGSGGDHFSMNGERLDLKKTRITYHITEVKVREKLMGSLTRARIVNILNDMSGKESIIYVSKPEKYEATLLDIERQALEKGIPERNGGIILQNSSQRL